VSTIIVTIVILLITGAIITDVAAIAPTGIDDCDSRSMEDGQRLVLTEDISTRNIDCLLISNSNVTLDCRGFTINGVTGTDSVGVRVTNDGVTVKNCIISNFEIGIKLEDSDGSTVTKNTLTSNILGIVLESNSDDNTITANTSTGSDSDGIMIMSSKFNKIARNTFIQNEDHGIRISDSDSNMITLNNATKNNLDGIMLLNGADSNTIKKNISNNNRDGISVCDGCDLNILTLNTANSNERDGFVDHAEPLSNTYKNNKCSENGEDDSMPPDLCS